MSEFIEIAGFPITADVKLTKSGTYRDIAYCVTNHGRNTIDYTDPTYKRRIPTRGTYCYYVYVSQKMLSKEEFSEFWLTRSRKKWTQNIKHAVYDYNEAKWSNANWHGGITWYSKETGFDGDNKCVRIGCDYAHSWDEGQYYTLYGAETDAKSTIDALCEMYSFYRRDSWNGDCLPEAQMIEHEGKLYSPKGLENLLAFQAERKATCTVGSA